MAKTYSYNQPLYILPFDHRSSFFKLFTSDNRELAKEESDKLKEYKMVIYEGFKYGLNLGVPKDEAAILVDEEFGEEVIKNAKSDDVMFAVATEKSGQSEFVFEYGDDFGDHLIRLQPTFAKALLRYNPEDDEELKKRQCERLHKLSEFAKQHQMKFLVEPLIKPSDQQLAKVGGDKSRYDNEIRPKLVPLMMGELQAAGVEPDIWKIEGMLNPADYTAAVGQARSGGRETSLIILGRGDKRAMVEAWLKAGARVAGAVGFAIGRTIFWEAIKDLHNGAITKDEAAKIIGTNYFEFYRLFSSEKIL